MRVRRHAAQAQVGVHPGHAPTFDRELDPTTFDVELRETVYTTGRRVVPTSLRHWWPRYSSVKPIER
jgi:hypothetical protein